MKELTSAQKERYERNILTDIGEEGQSLLCSSSVMVIGIGGLGSAVVSYLTASGVGSIGIADYDTVSVSNLQRQILYGDQDLGMQKTLCARQRMQYMNSDINIDVYNVKIDVDNIDEIVSKYDVIVDCTDNYTIRYIVDDSCSKNSKPMVYGSVEQTIGQVSTFHYKKGESYEKLYPRENARANREKIGVLSPMVGIIGSIQALEVVKILTKHPHTLDGKLLVADMDRYNIRVFEL